MKIGQPIRLLHSSRWFTPSPHFRTPPTNNTRRSCTSGGLLLVGMTSGPSSAGSIVASCAIAADLALSGNVIQKAKISQLTRQALLCRRAVGERYHGLILRKRAMSSDSGKDGNKSDLSSAQKPQASQQNTTERTPLSDHQQPEHESLADSMSKYLHLPKMPHRPTKEELLAAATGFWERLKVRFKWFSIRSMRPWNADEWGAFVSWFLFGHIVWVLVGTTTFFSLIILTINTVFAQGKFMNHFHLAI